MTASMLRRDVLEAAVKSVNKWHPNTPLLLVFSRQTPGPLGSVSGNLDAVRNVYDTLFNLELIDVKDDARKYYLHFCHGAAGAKDYPFALKKPTDNYGKTHQRIINDTFAGNKPTSFLTRVSEGKYKLKDNAAQMMLEYLGGGTTGGKIDLKPLVLIHFWKSLQGASTVRDLWSRFCRQYGVNKAPFSEVFTCSGLDEPLQICGPTEAVDMRLVCLPGEYGSGAFDGNFWNRFRSLLEDNLQRLKWQGRTSPLVNGITAALMNDQAVFLLGAPGTGKTTVVTDAILPALREAIGTENELRFSEFPLTPASTSSDVFGFQGLDGNWVAGPFVRDVMIPYEVEAGNIVGDEVEDLSARVEDGPEKRAHVVFFDEANRVDIEALLSPIQSALDRMQARRPGGVVTLGRGQYTLPSKLWRIYAGNSPATDIGRKEQSRPFKRRLSVVLPPDPIEELVGNTSRFRAACLELLERATNVKDVEVSEPALGMVGDLSANPARLEDLRLVLEAVRALPQVAVTVGLVESILLRAAAHRSLRQDSPIDSALTQSLVGLLSGDATDVERVAQVAEERTFSLFAQSVRRDVLQPQHADGHFEVDALL